MLLGFWAFFSSSCFRIIIDGLYSGESILLLDFGLDITARFNEHGSVISPL